VNAGQNAKKKGHLMQSGTQPKQTNSTTGAVTNITTSYSWLDVLNAIAQGLEIEPEVAVLEHCKNTWEIVSNRTEHSFSVLFQAIGSGGSIWRTDNKGNRTEVTWVDAWVDATKSIYDLSHWFKDCYSRTEDNGYVFWLWLNHYQSLSNYIANLVPNSLSYGMYYSQWATKLEELEGVRGRELELYYVYAVIIRKLFFFDYVPDAFNDQLEPLDIFGDDATTQKLLSTRKHLKAVVEDADPETRTFITQFMRYSRLLGVAFAQTLDEFSIAASRTLDHLTRYTGSAQDELTVLTAE